MKKAKPRIQSASGKNKKSVRKKPSPKKPSKKKNSAPEKSGSRKISARSIQASQLEARLKYDKALAACAHELLVHPDFSSQPLQKSIEHLRKAAEASRVYIFECFQDPRDGLCARQTFEAVARGIRPEINNPDLQHFPFEQVGFGRWRQALSQGKHIGGRVARFPKSERAVLEPQDILSILVLPVFVDRNWYGFIGFDDCVDSRAWSRDEVRMLQAASEIIGGYLSQKKMESILRDTQAQLEIQLKQQRDDLQSAHHNLNQEVTERKRSDTALMESEARFRQLAENVSEILWFTSINGKKVIYTSPAYESIFGGKVEELYQRPESWTEFIHPADQNKVLNSFTQKNLTEGKFDIEFRIARKDGSIRWIKTRGLPIRNSQGRVYRIAGIARDITEEKTIKNQLIESEERFRSLVHQAADAFFVHDGEGFISEVNPKACESLGYTREELLQMSVSDIEVSMKPQEIIQGLQNLKPGESVTFEGLHRRRNQTTFPVEVNLGPINWKGRTYLLATARDITQRKRVELELLKTKDAAEKASQAKSEFLSRVSHELRTPLNAILGFGQLLENYSNQTLSKLQYSQVNEILKAGHHLLELINDVLDLSNIEAGKMKVKIECIPLKPVLEETLGMVEPMAGDKGVTLVSDFANLENLKVSGDRTRLKQVFLNLFTNAIKYNRDRGSVHIRGQAEGEGSVRVHIEDTGRGIPRDKQEIIFEPFQRLEYGPAPVEGTGMGLSIVKNLMTMMGGEIDVHSDGKTGSRFTVTFRSLDPQEIPHDSKAASGTSLVTHLPLGEKDYKVLYIEDNRSNLVLVEQIMQTRPKIRLLTCDHPKEGIKTARETIPDLILLDINLPDMDGYSVMKILQGYEETRDIPVIAVSAHVMQEDIDRALSTGFTHYLPKPIQVDTLLHHIDALLTGQSR